MNTLRDAGIDVVPVTGGFRYELPRRTGKPVKVAGVVIGIFGLFATSIVLPFMTAPLQSFMQEPGGARGFLLVFGLFGLVGLIPALAMLAVGFGAAAGRSRCAVEVTAQTIKLVERCGWLRWTWTRNRADVTAFSLSRDTGLATSAHGQTPGSPAPGFGALKAMGDNPAATLLIGPGYPNALLEALGVELSALTRLPLTGREDANATEVDAQAWEQAADRRTAEQPPKTDIVVQQLANGVGISVPPAGLVRGSKGLFVFAIIWLVFCALIFGVTLATGQKAGSRDNAPVQMLLFPGVFVAIGVGMLVGAISMGKRRALIAVADGVLTIRQIGLRKTREWRFERGEAAAVRMGPSGVEVNEKPVMELQVLGRDGKKKVGLLSQRRDEELQWLAAVLRQALNVRPEPPPSNGP